MDNSSCVPQKQCFKCKRFFPATVEFFYSNKGRKDGFASRCKNCWNVDKKPRYIPPEGYKHCPGCNQDLPCTADFFYVSKHRPDGFASHCKSCKSKKQLSAYKHAKERKIIDLPETLICGRCKVGKPATLRFFSMNPLCRYGLNTTCKTCLNAKISFNRRKNLEKARLKERKYYRSKRILYYKLRYQQKREQILARQHAFCEAHPEKVHEWKYRYSKTEKGRLAHKRSVHNRRSRKMNADGTYTLQEIEQQNRRQKGKCYYCHKKMKKHHIEHVQPLSRGGRNDISNIVLSCPECNTRKGSKCHERTYNDCCQRKNTPTRFGWFNG